jgi:GR25 family glycosyltransferase involved in LPS biosynthesis
MEAFAMPLEAIKSQTRRFASPRRFILLLASLVAASLLLICLCQTFNLYNSSQAESNSSSKSLRLGVADKIYVISLPNRHNRREDMEKLRLSLQLHWVYVDALDANSPLVSQIMDWVMALRTGPPHILDEANLTHVPSKLLPDSITFAWPGDIEILATSKDKLDLWSTVIWPSPITSFFKLTPYPPIACATKNYSLTKYTAMLKEHLILTAPRVACWHSHLSVIHDIVNNGNGVSVILEDDVDMEQDIQKQLAYLWPTLPADWDILFLGIFFLSHGLDSYHLNICHLGHCWSDEAGNGPLTHQVPLDHTIHSFKSRLYIARKPKCTHAYALSRNGARRLLLHLRYPPFAYSRAIDQAISWLVESGRLKGFSIVPSLVIQRKVTESDVMPGKGMGSQWKDSLTNGFFEDSQLQIV